MKGALTIRATPVAGLDDVLRAVQAARTLDLPEVVLERLKRLCEGIRNFIVCGDLIATASVDILDLPLRLELPSADMMFLATLRAGDIGAIAHGVIAHGDCPSVGVSTTPTVSAGGIGVTAGPAWSPGNDPTEAAS